MVVVVVVVQYVVVCCRFADVSHVKVKMGICKHDARSPDPHAVVKASAAFPNAATLSAHDTTVFI